MTKFAGYTEAQQTALNAAFDKRGAAYARVSRTGGAFRRCCDRLAAEGLLSDEPPFPITIRGLKALRDIRAARWGKHGCMAYLNDLQSVEAALADVPHLAARVG